MSAETKAGLFFVTALIILGVLTFKVEDLSSLWRETYTLHAKVRHAGGLEVGDTVSVAGLAVGKVSSMRLDEKDDYVHLVLTLDRRFRVGRGSIGVIAWEGLLGGRYVDITRPPEPEAYLRDGDELEMREAIRPDAIFTRLESAVSQAQDFLKGDPFGGLRDLAPKIEKGLADLSGLVEDLRSGEGTFTKLLKSDELYSKFNQVADDLKGASAEVSRVVTARGEDLDRIIADLREATPQLKNAAASIESVAAKAEKGEGPLVKLLSDKAMAEDLDKAVGALRNFAARLDEGEGLLKRLVADKELAARLEQTLDNLQRISDNLAKGEGSAGKLLTDPGLYAEIKGLVGEARDVLRGIKEQIPVGALGSAISSAF